MSEEQLKRIRGFSVPQIFELIKRWDEILKKKMNSSVNFNKEGEDIKTVQKFSDGSRIVKLLSQKSLDEEGRLMGHCLTSEYKNSHFSLRDSKGYPHVTMELDSNKTIHQIKGKENKSPVSKYVPYIIDFIEKNNLNVSSEDARNIGFVKWDDKYYNPSGNLWKQIYQDEIIPKQNKVFKEIKSKIVNGRINGNVDLRNLHLTKLPDFIKDTIVSGNFYCSYNQLTSLQGAPQSVGGSFYCSYNQLTSLQGSPKSVGGSFFCNNNQLTSFQGFPKTQDY